MGIENSPDLRAMVREVLREALATRGAQTPARAAAEVARVDVARTEPVRIINDADLQALVTRLTAPGAAEAVRAGTLRFSLAGASALSPAMPVAAQATTLPTLDGVISERKLKDMAHGATVRLTRCAVLTPLAKDLGRRLGLNFERIG